MSHLIPIDEVVYFDVITRNPATAAVSDADSTPTFDVYEEATDTGLLGATNLTKRTSLTGDYRGTFTASAANGFEAGKWYSVVVSATVNTVADKYVAMIFRVAPAEAVAGVPKVDLTYILGTILTETAGQIAAAFRQFFNIASPTSTMNTITTVTTATNLTANNDKTGYSLSSAGVDAILDEAISEPVSVFVWGSGATLRSIIGWIGALARNKITETSALQTLRNDADSANIATAAVSDDNTTATRAEWQ